LIANNAARNGVAAKRIYVVAWAARGRMSCGGFVRLMLDDSSILFSVKPLPAISETNECAVAFSRKH
jgi:hypothetical protein